MITAIEHPNWILWFWIVVFFAAICLVVFCISMFNLRTKKDVGFAIFLGVVLIALTISGGILLKLHQTSDPVISTNVTKTTLYSSTPDHMQQWAEEFYGKELKSYDSEGNLTFFNQKSKKDEVCVASYGKSQEIPGTGYVSIPATVYCNSKKMEPIHR